MDGQRVLVQGLEINDRDYRGEYTLEIYSETELTWHGTEISIAASDIFVDISKIPILSD